MGLALGGVQVIDSRPGLGNRVGGERREKGAHIWI